jgi:putative transcriptional regulator
MRSELVEAARVLHKLAAYSDDELQKTTIRMLDREALPKVGPLKPIEIVALREKVGVSQAVLAAYLNVGVTTVSQWERGERRPTGTALKLLSIIERHGLAPLQ